ncbi:MAG TPA: response regulator transcription factor [Chitinophagales bacterium]|nr:response regulator transcription factor [Chitinophagales bacterium]
MDEQKSIRVMIVEDNDEFRDSLINLVEEAEGFEFAGAFSDCKRIVQHLSEFEPDVVLMDIDLPGISGIEGVLLIKEKFPDAKILMLTVFEANDKIFNSLCAGASGYLLKSTIPSRILEAVKEIHEGGAPMTPSVAARVLKMFRSQAEKPSLESFTLSDREKEVLNCLVKGMSYKMVASHCFISADTVNAHIRNIYKKMQVHSKSEAVAKAIKGRIV